MNTLIKGIVFILGLLICLQAVGTELYVGRTSSATKRDGSASAPYASLEDALRHVRELRRLNDPQIRKGAKIYVQDGVYHPEQPILIRPEDSGTSESPTEIIALGKSAIISGGVEIRTWQKLNKHPEISSQIAKHIYVAEAPRKSGRYFSFRQLWVNGKKGIRAESHDDQSLPRILNWNFENGTAIIPNVFPEFELKAGMEFFIHQWWAIAQLRVKDAKVSKDSIVLSFHEPEAKLQNEHPWPKPWLSKEHGNSAFRLVNSLQFLDEPGEWYLDEDNHKVYYYKRSDEQLTEGSVIVPYLETLVDIVGSPESPVQYVSFHGLQFKHSSWMRPHFQGHVALQAGMYFLDAYKLKVPGTADKKGLENQAWLGRPQSAVSVKNSAFTSFQNCRFEHLGASAIDFVIGNFNDTLTGNVFKDIAGNAIVLGKFSDPEFEAHLPYLPNDNRVVTTGTIIRNNLVTNVGNEDWGAVGIAAGFVKDVVITNNDLSDLPYTGISLGWGWTPTVNVMKNNTVSRNNIVRYGKYMYDVAGIYTLSAQPGTKIQENRIDSIYVSPYAHLPEHWFYLYTDEGSAYMQVTDNWFPSEKILQNANGPAVIWENNGPAVSKEKLKYTGLESTYSHLLSERHVVPASAKFNAYTPFTKPVFVQFRIKGQELSKAELSQFLKRQGADVNELYHWNEYAVLKTNDELGKKIVSAAVANYPTVEIKLFNDLFYAFDRSRCGDDQLSDSLDYVVLTCALKDDKEMQKTYYQMHATQFEEWPQVAKGFCQAGFQEVLLYRKDNQLMLFISFPKGKRFEDIDPLTVRNNPKVKEWNEIMSTFQVGIPGTDSHETWIFYKK